MKSAKQHPSLVDVARHAGVSASTASRVLNRSTAVNADARARVLAAAAALGYTLVPRALPAARQNAVALLLPDILNPYFAEVVRGVQDEINGDEYLPILLDTVESSLRERQFLRMLSRQPVQGVIVLGSRILADADLGDLLRRLGLPMVFINRTLRLPNVANVKVDFEGATYRATRHLLDLHHHRIAFLPGPREYEVSLARRHGIERALGEAGLALSGAYCLPSYPTTDGGFEAASALLALPAAERPSAIITYNDLMALGVLHAVRAQGLSVPDDLSVIGIDNIAMAEHANPPLTTIAQPKYQLGRLAMKTLRRMLSGQPPAGESYMLIESPLVVRASTGPAPVEGG
ncbi:MAG: LacI family DNA-binding transcriptional regulator [Anaerolineales bacterium]|nr:LacI family DNA-binding transcriptional regulator [Anaerolineales bacterium]